MRRTAITAGVAALMGALLFTAAPAQALSSDPGDFGGKTIKDFRLGAPASLLENPGGPDQKGYDAKFANMLKYNLDPKKRTTPFRPPVTAGTKLVSRAGGVVTGLLSYPLVIGLADSVASEAFGIDLNGDMCKNTQAGWMSVVTGLSCDGASGPDAGYILNGDASTGFVGGPPITVTTDAFHYWLGPGLQDVQIEVLGLQFITEPGYDVGGNQACLRVSKGGVNFMSPGSPEGMGDGVDGLEFNWAGGSKGMGTLFYASPGTPGSYLATPNSCGPYPGTGGKAFGPGTMGDPLTDPRMLESMTWGGKTSVMKEGTADPDRRLECTVTTTTGATHTALGAIFKESAGAFPAPTCPALPSGEVAERVKINEIGGPAPKTLADEPVSDNYAGWAAAYPECSAGTCLLDLRKVTGETTTQSCFDAAATCADWLQDPAKTDNYKCLYGTHAVSLDQCKMYGPTFKPDAVATGQVYGDPTTGEAPGLENPSTVPADKALYDSQVQSQEQPRQCYPQGWAAMNPLEWVMKPTMCALEWAFVPSAAKLEVATARMQSAWDETPMVKIGFVIGEWSGAVPSLDGCSGPRVSFAFHGMGGDYYPLDACSGPLATAAPVARLLGALAMYVGAFFAITRYLGAAYGYRGLGSGGSE